MHPREVRVLLERNRDVNPVIAKVMIELADNQHAMEKMLSDLASHIIKLSDVMQSMTHVTDVVRKDMNKLKGVKDQFDMVRSEEIN